MKKHDWKIYYKIEECECGGMVNVHIPQIWNQPKGSPNFKCNKCGKEYLLSIDEEAMKVLKCPHTITEIEGV